MAKARQPKEASPPDPVIDRELLNHVNVKLNKNVVRELRNKKKPSARQVVEWIFEALAAPLETDPLWAPSLGAWALFRNIIVEGKQHWFYESMYKPLLPSRAQMELEAQFTDDGRELADFAKAIAESEEVSVFEYRPEGLSGEPQVQGASASQGVGELGSPAPNLDDVPP